MTVEFALEPEFSAEEFQSVLIASTLAERRPSTDLARLDRMLRGADIIVTAREGSCLIGISRAITDHAYCCYLSDLAVDAAWQRKGIGKRLIVEAHRAAGPDTTLILLAAPAAADYYPKIGMTHLPNCWAIARTQ